MQCEHELQYKGKPLYYGFAIFVGENDGHSVDKLHCQEICISMQAIKMLPACFLVDNTTIKNCLTVLILSIKDGLPVWVKSGVWKFYEWIKHSPSSAGSSGFGDKSEGGERVMRQKGERKTSLVD